MRKAVTALAAAASIAAATIGASSTAEARWGGWWGPAIIGGFAAGAIVGSAYARPYPYGYYGYYAPAPVYYDYYMPAPAYYGYYGPRCQATSGIDPVATRGIDPGDGSHAHNGAGVGWRREGAARP